MTAAPVRSSQGWWLLGAQRRGWWLVAERAAGDGGHSQLLGGQAARDGLRLEVTRERRWPPRIGGGPRSLPPFSWWTLRGGPGTPAPPDARGLGPNDLLISALRSLCFFSFAN